MAFPVSFYTFSKKQNSTMIPSTAALSANCQAKIPLDVINPTIQLQLTGGAAANPSAYNYAYIAAFSRYYWIRTWRNAGPLWEADLEVDALASWKASIGSQTCYIYRAAASFDRRIPDTLYPTTTLIRQKNVTLSKPWTVGGASASGAASNSGCFVAGIISTNGTNFYAFTPSGWSLFIQRLQEDDYFERVLGVFGATEYPEAKVAINPMQYISSVKWCPVGYGASGSWCIHTGSALSTINVGVSYVSISELGAWHCWLLEEEHLSSVEDVDTQTQSFDHPQASARGEWLNLSPYTSIEVFYPPFGLIELDPAIISKFRYLRFSLSLDSHTCTCKLDIYCHDNLTHRNIYRGFGSFGIDIPVSTIVQPGTSPMSYVRAALGITQGVAQAATGNLLGAASSIIGGVNGAIGSAVAGQIPHLSAQGGPGSTAQLDGTPTLYLTQWYLADDDPTDKGRPLCTTETIGNGSGFMMCDSDHVSIACTKQELQTIKTALAAGFYYE